MSVPTFEFVVEQSMNGVRIDTYLTRQLRNYSTWRMQRIVREGGARIDFAPAHQTERVFTGQSIQVRLLEPPDKPADVSQVKVPILYEDPWLMVLNKPAGMIVHPVGADQSETLVNAVQGELNNRGPCRGLFRPGIVHRLDRQTSGAIAVALTHQAHVEMSAAFEASRVAKTYLALVEGKLQQDQGVIDYAIGRANTGRHVLMSCRADAKDRKPSRTNYTVVQRFPEHTLVSAKPRTGRNHQIRVHFAAIGHPLVGDEFYLSGGRFRPFYADLDPDASRDVETGLFIKRHALHAQKLEFAHPISGAWIEICAGLPDDFQTTIDSLR